MLFKYYDLYIFVHYTLTILYTLTLPGALNPFLGPDTTFASPVGAQAASTHREHGGKVYKSIV